MVEFTQHLYFDMNHGLRRKRFPLIRKLWLILFFLPIFLSVFIGPAWGQNTSPSKIPDFSQEDIAAGKKLAHQYCQMCHLLPDPKALDKKTWYHSVMPNMSVRLGRFSIGHTSRDSIPAEWYEKGEGGQRVRAAKIFPTRPLVSADQWRQLVAYYTSNAPVQALRIDKPLAISIFNFPFQVHKPKLNDNLSVTTTFVKIQRNSGKIFVGEAARNSIKVFNREGQLQSQAAFNSPPVQLIELPNNTFMATLIGSIPASDQYKGEIVLLKQNAKNKQFSAHLLKGGLARPVFTSIADFNGDRQSDLLISGFGNWTGNLSWFEKQAGTQFKQHVLTDLPGSLHTYPHDFNRDGKVDIIALKAHGDEGIYLYTNQGQGKFKKSTLARFPPSYGSNYLEIVDFNKDGFMDIIMTNGDNADYTPILKKYHGVRVFINQKNGRLKEKYFFPMYGAVKAKAFDYDLDGDLDIAAIAFFPDFNANLKHSFVLLNNRGKDGFLAFSFKEASSGRWMAMDTGDIDNDGDIDIVLGAHNMEADLPNALQQRWRKAPVPLLILENKIRQTQEK